MEADHPPPRSGGSHDDAPPPRGTHWELWINRSQDYASLWLRRRRKEDLLEILETPGGGACKLSAATVEELEEAVYQAARKILNRQVEIDAKVAKVADLARRLGPSVKVKVK
mgnify:CR=1 FL=1